jgi:hypothetical protein
LRSVRSCETLNGMSNDNSPDPRSRSRWTMCRVMALAVAAASLAISIWCVASIIDDMFEPIFVNMKHGPMQLSLAVNYIFGPMVLFLTVLGMGGCAFWVGAAIDGRLFHRET